MLFRAEQISFRLLFLIFLISICCTNQKRPKLEGHWVSTDYFEGKGFFTIDFRGEKEKTEAGHDTVVQYIEINKNSLNYYQGWATNLIEENGVYYYYVGHGEEHSLTFVGDNIIANGDYHKGKLVRVDDSSSAYDELFTESGFAVKLPEADQTACEKLETRLISHIFVGRPSASDTVLVNVADGLIQLNELPKFVREVKLTLDEGDRDKLLMILVADSSINQALLGKVILEIKKETPIVIAKAFYNYQTQQVCYKKIKDSPL